MSSVARLVAAVALCSALSSCVDPGIYPDGGFAAGNYYDGGYNTMPIGGGYRPYGRWGGFGGGGAYRCSRCASNPCRCGNHHHGSSNRSEPQRYRIVSGDLKGKAKPNGYYPVEWFHERGYSLQNVKVETADGRVIDRRPSSSSSSNSSRSSSSASKSRSSSSSSSKPKSSSSKTSSKPSSSKPSGSGMVNSAAQRLSQSKKK